MTVLVDSERELRNSLPADTKLVSIENGIAKIKMGTECEMCCWDCVRDPVFVASGVVEFNKNTTSYELNTGTSFSSDDTSLHSISGSVLPFLVNPDQLHQVLLLWNSENADATESKNLYTNAFPYLEASFGNRIAFNTIDTKIDRNQPGNPAMETVSRLLSTRGLASLKMVSTESDGEDNAVVSSLTRAEILRADEEIRSSVFMFDFLSSMSKTPLQIVVLSKAIRKERGNTALVIMKSHSFEATLGGVDIPHLTRLCMEYYNTPVESSCLEASKTSATFIKKELDAIFHQRKSMDPQFSTELVLKKVVALAESEHNILVNMKKDQSYIENAKLSISEIKEERQAAKSVLEWWPENEEGRGIKKLDELLGDLLKSSPIILFMKGQKVKPFCKFSKEAIRILLQYIKPEDFSSVNVMEHQIIRERLKTYSNWPTYPQFYLNGELQGGIDIIKEMEGDGELEGEILAVIMPSKSQ